MCIRDRNLVLVEKKENHKITKKVLDSVLFVPLLTGIVEDEKL